MTKLANTKATRIAARWTPVNGVAQPISALDAVVWTYPKAGTFNVCIYQGSKTKPVLHVRTGSVDSQAKIIDEWVKGENEKAEKIKNHRAEVQKDLLNFFSELKIGSIFYTLSGYEQTNASFFEVVGEVTKNAALVRPIEHEVFEASLMAMYGHALPKQGCYSGVVEKWKVKKNYPSIWDSDRKVNISWYG